MYDNLLQLPLFQGLGKDDFTTIIEKVKFHFMSFKKGEAIIRQGDACKQIVFLLNGEIIAQTMDEKRNYLLSEKLDCPHIIEPYSLFGMQTRFTATYRANTSVQILAIDKAYIFSELNKYEIFRINYLNLLSNRCQCLQQKLWDNHVGTLKEKFINFLLNRCQRADGEKTLLITMEDLANIIDETRINVSRMLNEFQDKELIQLKRKEILIPDLKKLSGHME